MLGVSKHGLVIAGTFATGLAIGVLAVIAIQNIASLDEQSNQEVAQGKLEQTSTNSANTISTTERIDVGQFQEIFKYESISEQDSALHSTLSKATEHELNDWWLQSQTIERDSHRKLAQRVILQNLTMINPQEALRKIEEVSQFEVNALLKSVFSQWSVSELEGAIEAAASFSDPRRRIALQAIVEARDDLSESTRRSIASQLSGEETFLKLASDTLASQNITEPKQSWEILLNDGVKDSLQTDSLVIVAEAWREQIGFEVLTHIYEEVKDYWLQQRLLEAVAEMNPDEALSYTLGLSSDRGQVYMSGVVVRNWARQDVQAALAAVSNVQPASLASQLEESVAFTWAEVKPRELIENIASIAEESRLRSLESAFRNIARQDPLEAVAKLSSVEDYVGNTSTIAEWIVMYWARQQPDAAADWVVSTYAQDNLTRRRLLEDVLPGLSLKNPDRAFELAMEQPLPSRGSGLERIVVGEIARSGDIELAKKLLPRVREDTKLIAYSEVGKAMVRKSQTDEALELGNEFSGTQHKMYYGRVFNAWTKTEARSLFEFLDDLPSSDLKSIAARELITRSRFEPVFTDEEIDHAKTFLNDDDQESVKFFEEM